MKLIPIYTEKSTKLAKLGKYTFMVDLTATKQSIKKTVLDFLAPLITEPAIFCLDDWKLNDLDLKGLGEYKSFNEFLENNPNLETKEIKSYNRKSRSFLIKPKF